MSDIPEDVMEAAREAARGIGRVTGVKWENPTDEQVTPIAHAILDERERCARIAENWQGAIQAAAIRNP